MVGQAANLCQQTSLTKVTSTNVNFLPNGIHATVTITKRGGIQSQGGWPTAVYLFDEARVFEIWSKLPLLTLSSSCWWSEKSFLFSHRYVCHWSCYKTFHSILVKCHSNPSLSDWFSKGFKEGSEQPFTSLSQVVSQPFLLQNSHSTLIAFRYW